MSVTLALLLMLPSAVLQEAPPDPDAAYREDYADYTEISQMTDPAAQCEAYLNFLDEGPDERLLEFVASGTLQCMNALSAAGSYDAVYAIADRLAMAHPPSAGLAGAIALDAAAKAGNSEMVVKYGEPYYEANPDPEIARILSQSFAQLGNQDKMVEYGHIVVDSDKFPIGDIWPIVFQVIQDDDSSGNKAEAVELARSFRSAVAAAPSDVTEEDWNGIQVYLLDMIARDDFDAGRYGAALPSFDAILALQPRNDKAHYFKGNAMLQSGGSVNQATQELAKAAVLEGNYSGPAMTLLQSTFASNAPGATADRYVQEALATARRELGL